MREPLPIDDKDFFGNLILKGFIEIDIPENVSWMPQTVGWKVLFVVLFIAGIWWGYKRYQSWLRNRYRQVALDQLSQLAEADLPDDRFLQRLSTIIKGTALHAQQRTEIAALSGESWLQYINQDFGQPVFEKALEPLMSSSLYGGDSVKVSQAQKTSLVESAKRWIAEHKIDPEMLEQERLAQVEEERQVEVQHG